MSANQQFNPDSAPRPQGRGCFCCSEHICAKSGNAHANVVSHHSPASMRADHAAVCFTSVPRGRSRGTRCDSCEKLFWSALRDWARLLYRCCVYRCYALRSNFYLLERRVRRRYICRCRYRVLDLDNRNRHCRAVRIYTSKLIDPAIDAYRRGICGQLSRRDPVNGI